MISIYYNVYGQQFCFYSCRRKYETERFIGVKRFSEFEQVGSLILEIDLTDLEQ